MVYMLDKSSKSVEERYEEHKSELDQKRFERKNIQIYKVYFQKFKNKEKEYMRRCKFK